MKFEIISAAIALSMLTSCIREDIDECGMWLEFVFDHNMEYTDSFYPRVGVVDVYFFDESGIYLFARHAESGGLRDHDKMFLGGEMPPGNYRIVTVGGLGGNFHFSDIDGMYLVPGATTIDQVKLALKHEGAVTHEFPDLWFGADMDMPYRTDLSVCRVPLIRETNRFHITLQHTGAGTQEPYTIEIAAPESGAYDYRNDPLLMESTVYRPYRQESETGASIFQINTMRLLLSEGGGYRLSVRHADTGAELWGYDLLALLGYTKPAYRPDGTTLPMQEYLDRQGEWNIVIIHDGGAGESFAAMQVIVNGWIVWEHSMGV